MMLNYDEIFSLSPFALRQEQKDALYETAIQELTAYHRARCELYRRITDIAGAGAPLPVRLFKEYDLLSVPREEIVKTMSSSGTTGQRVSKIYLDRATSARQSKALTKIVSDFTGKTRLPMLIIDSPSVLKNREMFSARGAGILGFSMLGTDRAYALNERMELDLDGIYAFLDRHAGARLLLFGFTFMIWQYFCKALAERGVKLQMEGVLIHGGGWKKLADQKISDQMFKTLVADTTGIQRVYNYYGMVEQTGSIFMECEYGHLHASLYSDVIIRKPYDFSIAKVGEPGLIELRSVLPTSYPGHVLLSEDEGEILGVDDCPCGRKGKYFKIHGRIKGAELRGCSDTYERR